MPSLAALPRLLSVAALAAACAGSPAAGPDSPAAQTEPPTLAPLPDLTITAMYLEMEGRHGGCVVFYTPYGIRVRVENIGDAAAASFGVGLNQGQQIVEAGLPPGQSIVLHFADLVKSGEYTAQADPADQVIESDESNNSMMYLAPTPTPPPLCTAAPAATPTSHDLFVEFRLTGH